MIAGYSLGVATNGMFLSEALLDALPREGLIVSVSPDDLHIMGSNPDSDFNVDSRAILAQRVRMGA